MPSSIGIVDVIGTAPEAGAEMQERESVMALEDLGLEGDRYASAKGSFNKETGPGNRQVTLINARFILRSTFSPLEPRRNIVVSGTELMWLIGREFSIGEAVMRGIKYCDPCQRPSKLSKNQASFMQEFQDCGGLVAEILQGGWISRGSLLTPPKKNY